MSMDGTATENSQRANDPDPKVSPLLMLDQRDRIRANMANVETILARDARYARRLSYDTFKVCALLDDQPLDDQKVAELRIAIDRAYGIEVPKAKFWEAALAVAMQRTSSSLKDFLNKLIWDRTPRLDSWLKEALGADDTKIVRVFGRKWSLVRSLARSSLAPRSTPRSFWSALRARERARRSRSSRVRTVSATRICR